METTLNELCIRIEQLEADLAAATLEMHRMRDASKRRRAAHSAVVTVFAVIIVASWTLGAQTPTRIPGPQELSNQRSSSRVKAPFEVVDDAGKFVFRVQAGAPSNSFSLFNASGVAGVFASAFAGLFVKP